MSSATKTRSWPPRKLGAEGVAQHVAAEAGVAAAFGGDGQQDVVGAAGRQAAAAAVEQHCRAGVSAGPAGAFIADPEGEGLAQPGVHGDLAVAAAFAGPYGDQALAG